MTDAELQASRATTGLSAAEAAARLKAEGFNELPRAGRRSIVRLIVDVLREPMLLSLGLLEISKFPLRQALKRNQRVRLGEVT